MEFAIAKTLKEIGWNLYRPVKCYSIS